MRYSLFISPSDSSSHQEYMALNLCAKGKDWTIDSVSSLQQADRLMSHQQHFVCVLVLNQVQSPTFIDSIEQVVSRHPDVKWLCILAPQLLEQEAVRKMIFSNFVDYFTSPIDTEKLCATIGHLYGMAMLGEDQPTLKNNQKSKDIIGQSPALSRVRHFIDKVAPVSAPVLITGESGTGKEVVACSIHKQSLSNRKHFVVVNCGAIPGQLIQSELFGHEKGAFTNAYKRKIGKLEAANGGTLLLDEIGDLPLEAQVNLLRFLQEGTIERVGGTETQRISVRVIAATNIQLQNAISNKRFREDLFYRLNVLQIELPPLREREGDIQLLAEFYLSKFSKEQKINKLHFSHSARLFMLNYSWPGNIRELVNRIRRAVIMSDNHLLSLTDLGFDAEEVEALNNESLAQARARADQQVIKESLRYADNNISAASRILKISRLSLYRLLDKYQISH